MTTKRALLYLHEGLADWEASHILPELRDAHYTVETIAASLDPVRTMGGLRILPDHQIHSLNLDHVEILIMPGGSSWKNLDAHQAILELIPKLKARDAVIAAICDATLGLAHLGLLDRIHHTSNHMPALKASIPTYKGESLYQDDELAVTDDGIITASGIGALEFARAIISELVLMTDQESEEWYFFFKKGRIPSNYMDGASTSQGTPSPEIFGGP